ncbi:MAG: hypothetical protein ACJ8FY_28320 [Gemmataceae bacterium]
MRSLILSALLAITSIGLVGMTPSSAEAARPWRWRGYYPGYYSSSYYVPDYSYYAPSYSSYYVPGYASYYVPSYTSSYYVAPTYSSYYYPAYRPSYYPSTVYYSTPGITTYSAYPSTYYYP